MQKSIKKILFLLAIAFAPSMQAQEKNISGTIIDDTGIPLAGVNVVVQGTTTGTQTDFDGNYSIKASSGDILSFSYLGMKTQTVTVGNSDTVNITMLEDAAQLGEVVVVGYGTQKKVNLTGSISSIESSDIVKNTTSNLSSALSGRLAGVVTIQSSGEPGSDSSTFNIRGLSSINNSSPLILVDGVPRTMDQVNPNDIASLSVLKDAAAAAIYGMRAANGVVLITTKRGTAGKTQFSVDTYTGFQSPTRLLDFLGAADFANLFNEGRVNDGAEPRYTEEDIRKFSDGSSPNTHADTDWYEETLKKQSVIRSFNISAVGSSENNKISYFSSLGYIYQDALYNKNDYDRFNFRSNLDTQISDNIKLSTDFSGSLETINRPGVSASTLFNNLSRASPTLPNRFTNGEYSISSQTPLINGPGYTRVENFDFQSKIALNIDFPFLEGLNLIAQVAYDRSAGGNNAARNNFSGSQISFSVPRTYSVFDESTGEFSTSTPTDRGEKASLSEFRAKGFQLTTEAILSYSKTFKKHDFGSKLIFSRTATKYDFLSASINDILGTSVDLFEAGASDTRAISNGRFETAILGYAGRFTYAYDSKYLFEFNGRYDGSYKFSKDARFDFFPSFSLAWRISEENFLKDSNIFNNLKVRASYGELGSDAGVDPFRFLEFFEFSNPFVDNGTVLQSVNTSGLADASTTWEKSKTTNIGLDIGLWNNLFTLEVDAFYKRTSDILATRSLTVPGTFGAILPAENIGIVDNRGFEVVLKHNNNIKDLNYFVNVNFSQAKNEIVELAEPDDINPLIARTGRTIRTRYGFIAEGLFLTQQEIDDLNANAPDGVYQTQNPRPGDIKYADVNGDGRVDSEDRTVIGKGSFPEATFGVNLGFDYKQFDVSALFQGAYNFDMYLSNEAAWAFFNGGKVFDRHLDRARIGADGDVINTDATYPRITLQNNAVNERASSYWLEKGDYIRLKNVEIGYSLPQKILDKLGINKLRFYLNGRNLATWSKIKHLDPENPQQRGWFYPQQKVYNLGINLQF